MKDTYTITTNMFYEFVLTKINKIFNLTADCNPYSAMNLGNRVHLYLLFYSCFFANPFYSILIIYTKVYT